MNTMNTDDWDDLPNTPPDADDTAYLDRMLEEAAADTSPLITLSSLADIEALRARVMGSMGFTD